MQIFRELGAGMESVIVGVVGVLQFEVLERRLKAEYLRRGSSPAAALYGHSLDSERPRHHRYPGPFAHARHAACRGHARR
ncbi:MAG: hypothetical protein ACLS3M_01195 [Collinsella sp.]